jgi:hypothetical protein
VHLIIEMPFKETILGRLHWFVQYDVYAMRLNGILDAW